MYRLLKIQYIIQFVHMASASTWISLAFYCIYVVGVMCMPMTIFPIVGGVLFPFWIALPLNVIAATIGAWVSFRLSRVLGREALERHLKGKIKAWDKITSAQGFETVLILRFVGVPPFIVTNYALGFSGVSDFDYLLGTAIGILPWMSIVTYLSHSLWQAILDGGEKGLASALFLASRPLLILSAIVLVVFAVRFLLTRHKDRRRALHDRRHSNL